jgi:magnesium chelatase family protein
VPYERLRDEEPSRERSATVRERVCTARARMRARGRRANAELTIADTARHCRLDGGAEPLMAEAMRARTLSARGYHRVLRVARTAADLDGSERIGADHLVS